jgi:hypothetical protein
MPTKPSTSNPFAGAELLPEYVFPITAFPFTSSRFRGIKEAVPIPTFCALRIAGIANASPKKAIDENAEQEKVKYLMVKSVYKNFFGRAK